RRLDMSLLTELGTLISHVFYRQAAPSGALRSFGSMCHKDPPRLRISSGFTAPKQPVSVHLFDLVARLHLVQGAEHFQFDVFDRVGIGVHLGATALIGVSGKGGPR